LFEEAVYDSDGNLKSSNLAEYLVPAACDVPAITTAHTITPSPTNQLGVKGIGEAGTIGAAPTVMTAIIDALSSLGVTTMAMPASPQTVWKTIHPNLKGVNRVLKLRYLRQRPKLWQQGLPLNAKDPPSLESKYPTHPYSRWRNSKASECLCILPKGWKSYSLI
jgi:hypothetical protein